MADTLLAARPRGNGRRGPPQVVVHVDTEILEQVAGHGSLRAETARRSRRDRRGGSPATRRACCLGAGGQRSTSAARPGRSHPPCGARSPARDRGCRFPGLRRARASTRITFGTGRTAATRASTISSTSAATTTGSCTRAATPSPDLPIDSSSTVPTAASFPSSQHNHAGARRSLHATTAAAAPPSPPTPASPAGPANASTYPAPWKPSSPTRRSPARRVRRRQPAHWGAHPMRELGGGADDCGAACL